MKTTINNLEKNGFEVLHVKSKDEALHVAKEFVKDGLHVGFGGSTSVAQIGLLEYVLNHKNLKISNQYETGISMEENIQRRREGILSDLFITGCNAITKKGELINADGSGNRVAAQIFGPKKVLLIVSTDKIVENIDAGLKRIKDIAIPQNIERMNSIAIKMGKTPQYNSENIANKYGIIDADEIGRTTIILVDEKLGF